MKKCLVCGREYQEGKEAISRLDNKTAICSECGVAEAFDRTHSLETLMMRALLLKNEKDFMHLIKLFPELPKETMRNINEKLGRKLFEFED